MNRNFIMEQVIKVKQISAAQIVKLVGLIIFWVLCLKIYLQKFFLLVRERELLFSFGKF